MDNEPEVIRHQMDETRSALSDKLERLEQQVTDTVTGAAETVENVKHAVENTVQSVKDTVRETVESVQDTLDLRKQVERHPWTMMAGATAVGFIGGALLARSEVHMPGFSGSRSRSMSRGSYGNGHDESYSADYPPASRQPGGNGFSRSSGGDGSSSYASSMASGLSSTFSSTAWQPAIDKLKGLAVGAMFGVVRDLVKQHVPSSMESQLTEAIDGITTALGGKPISGSVLPTSAQSHSRESHEPRGYALSEASSYAQPRSSSPTFGRQTTMTDLDE